MAFEDPTVFAGREKYVARSRVFALLPFVLSTS